MNEKNIDRPYWMIRNYVTHMRSGLAADWLRINPLLKSREPALELDTRKVKIGDGVTLYKRLPYVESLNEFIWGKKL